MSGTGLFKAVFFTKAWRFINRGPLSWNVVSHTSLNNAANTGSNFLPFPGCLLFSRTWVFTCCSVSGDSILIYEIVLLFGQTQQRVIDKFFKGRSKFGSKEGNLVVGFAALTSWIAPCTVWISRKTLGKSWHLISSSFLTITAYSAALMFLGTFASMINFSPNDFPPLIYCFNNVTNLENKMIHFSQNTSFWHLFSFEKCCQSKFPGDR